MKLTKCYYMTKEKKQLKQTLCHFLDGWGDKKGIFVWFGFLFCM